MRKAIEGWDALVLKTEGDGDYKAAEAYAAKNGIVHPELQRDLTAIERANIPVDIVFEQGHKVLGLKPGFKPEKPGPKVVSPDKIQLNTDNSKAPIKPTKK